MRLIVDMNLTPRWVQYLRNSGFECNHWFEIGSKTAEDSTICDYAREHESIVITNDVDFPRILAHSQNAGPSVILLRGEPLTPESRGATLLAALAQCGAELEAGVILTIDWSERIRARLFPLKDTSL